MSKILWGCKIIFNISTNWMICIYIKIFSKNLPSKWLLDMHVWVLISINKEILLRKFSKYLIKKSSKINYELIRVSRDPLKLRY